jgi:hypothetical protein
MSMTQLVAEWIRLNALGWEVAPNTHGDWESRRIIQAGAHRSVARVADVNSVTLDGAFTGIYVKQKDCPIRDARTALFMAAPAMLEQLAAFVDMVDECRLKFIPVPDSLVEQADRAQQTIDAVMRDWVKSRVDLLCRRHLERKGGASNAAKA